LVLDQLTIARLRSCDRLALLAVAAPRPPDADADYCTYDEHTDDYAGDTSAPYPTLIVSVASVATPVRHRRIINDAESRLRRIDTKGTFTVSVQGGVESRISPHRLG